MNRKHFALIVIFFLAAVLRFWQLGFIPAGVTHDEVGYIYNAYSIAKTGKNVFGEFLPFLTWIGFPFLPVSIYLSAPFYWFFDISATTGRLPSALLGVLDVVLVYLIVKQLFKKSALSLLSALFLAISPWHLHFSRSAYDHNFALFFYLLAIVTFLWEAKKKRIPVISLIAFALAIFSYRGMNVIFIPLVLTLLWYGIKVIKISSTQVIVFLIGIGFIALSLLSVIALHGRAYLIAEGSILSDSKMQEEIDIQIREAAGPLSIKRIFLNKPMYIVNKLRENYIKAYSPEFLFLYTEPNNIYSIWSRGRIYFVELLFIILGIAYLYKSNKNAALFVTCMVLIGGLPGMLGSPYSARNFFMSAFLPILSGGGIVFLLTILKRWKTILMCSFIVAYLYLVGGYLFDYYGRFALYGAEAWAKSIKDVSFLIREEKDNYNKVVVGQASFGDFLEYAFYSKTHPTQVQSTWKNRSEEGKTLSFSFGNINFTNKCLDNGEGGLPSFEGMKPVLYFVREDCMKFATPSGIIRDYNRNTIWKFYSIH